MTSYLPPHIAGSADGLGVAPRELVARAAELGRSCLAPQAAPRASASRDSIWPCSVTGCHGRPANVP